MPFDARAAGALCDSCPLNGQKPVPPQAVNNPLLIVLGESPTGTDEHDGIPFSGAAGRQLAISCKTFGVKRSELHITNAVLCRTGGKKFKEWPKALECCKPRLDAELAALPTSVPILTCGEQALKAATGKDKHHDWVGAPLQSPSGHTVLATVHPGRTKPALLPVFRIHFGRALQLAQGQLAPWQWPEVVRQRGLPMLQALEQVRDAGKPIAVDVEAVPHLVLVGLATEDIGVSVPYPIEDPQIEVLVREIIAGPQEKVFHNAIFDIIKLQEYDFTVGGEVFDTILAHAVVGPELPHSLGFVAAIEFHANRWKTEYQLSKKLKKIDALLGPGFGDFQLYNGRDAIMTAILRPRLWQRLEKTHNGIAIFKELTELAARALNMASRGLLVDQERLQKHRGYRFGLMEQLRGKFRAIIADEQYKLGKTGQDGSLNRLFFEAFGIHPFRYTEEGDASLDESTLEDIIALGHPQASEAARVVKSFREHSTIVSRYIDKLPLDGHSVLHPNWKVFGTITGRWSSAKPNAQNWPTIMRDVVIARSGNYIVGADFSQLELRIIALLAGDEKLLEWYATNQDVHTITAKMLFAEQVAKTGAVPKGGRDIAKTVEYAFNYNMSSDVTTVWKTAVVQFPFLTVARMQKYRKLWMDAHPWIPKWQKMVVGQAERCKYVEAPVSGRRRYFHDGMIDPNEVLNFPNQATAADLTNKAILAVDKALDPAKEHIIAQVHDAIYVEGPDPDRLRAILVEAMTQTITLNGNTMTFPVDVGVGQNWTCSLKYKDGSNVCFKDFMSSLACWGSSPRAASRVA